MAKAIPVLRIFDYPKAVEFYIGWLGFKVDWEHKPDGAPVYMQVSLGDLALHLSEHHGDCSPGGKIHIEDFEGIEAYHQKLIAAKYKFNRPGLEEFPYDKSLLSFEATDPFNNRLLFTGAKSG